MTVFRSLEDSWRASIDAQAQRLIAPLLAPLHVQAQRLVNGLPCVEVIRDYARVVSSPYGDISEAMGRAAVREILEGE